MNSTSFFLGANTPNGFYSLFNELYDPADNWNMYIIKGGPGTGKSSLMKKVATKAEKKGIKVERIFCSSDPLSLDGVIIPEIKVSVADGTSPHVLEPVFPGVCEHIINLGKYWDTDKLTNNTNKIKDIAVINKNYHKKAVKYLSAANSIDSDINNIILKSFKTDKANHFVMRLCNKELSKTEMDTGSVKKRFLSGITPLGIVVQYDSFFELCDRIVSIGDKYSVASSYILKRIYECAEKKKIDMVVCMCPSDPHNKIDHIIFPNIRLGIFTSNSYHPMIKKDCKNIHCERFYDSTVISDNKNKITFLNKAKLELIGESVKMIEQAKAAHDILESYYIAAMDFSGVADETDKVINKIFG